MSTEHQQYSTDNQFDVLREYAAKRGLEIVRTFIVRRAARRPPVCRGRRRHADARPGRRNSLTSVNVFVTIARSRGLTSPRHFQSTDRRFL